jgi:hypothetical protein
MRTSKRLRVIATIGFLAVLGCASLRATTFETVTFDQMVRQADIIFVGTVVNTTPFAMQTRQGPIIKTRVTFSVSDAIYGSPGIQQVLEFVGGELNAVGLAVPGMPTFAIGDRRVVFARKDNSASPIVGFNQGLLRVVRGGDGVDRVQTLDGRPLARVEDIGTRTMAATVPVVPIGLSQFRSRIADALRQARKQ